MNALESPSRVSKRGRPCSRGTGAPTKAWACACLGLACALGGCSLQSMTRTLNIETSVRGEIVGRTAPNGEFVLRPRSCRSGDIANFRGVDLFGAALVVRVVADPLGGLGVALLEADSGDRRGIFRRENCTLLRGDVQRTGWRINDVAAVSGFVELECRLASGEEVAGAIFFEHCS